MVMEAQPSPQSVGREFVRQYYTLLNKAPNHLHRFYNNNSSFIHGESTLVVGQKNIHNRIQQLNFRDCHAKISQVDAQATLGNGVVVQVTGELSNDGQPMRRFTQTFVLAAQSPKKFYVHNDIFRYQDLYADEENDVEARSENGEEHENDPIVSKNNSLSVGVGVDNLSQQQSQVVNQQSQTLATQQQGSQQQQQQQQQTIYYSMPQNVVATTPRAVPVIAAQTVPLAQFTAAGTTGIQTAQLNGVVGREDILSGIPLQGRASLNQVSSNVVANPVVSVVATIPQVLSTQQQQTTSSVVASVEEQTISPQTSTGIPNISVSSGGLQQQQLQQQNSTISSVSIQQFTGHQQTKPLDNESIKTSSDTTTSLPQQSLALAKADQTAAIDDFKTINEQQQQEKYEAAAAAKQFSSNEPKTYANLFKSSNTATNNNSSFISLPSMQNQHQTGQQPNKHQQLQQQSSTNTYSSPTGQMKSDSSRIENNMEKNNTASLPSRSNSTRPNKDFEQRRNSTANSQQFSDSNQLFFGNVPHHATEEDLKALFSRFGQVMDLRIHSKSVAKVQGLRPPQNYGFITYDSPESVMNCLSNCPLYFPENSPDRQQLNVEEKKPRIRNLNDIPPRQLNVSGNNIGSNNICSTQRGNLGTGPSRSLSNTGSMMRGSGSVGNSLSRGSTGGGPRMGGFNRSENRGPSGSGTGGPQSRNGNSSNNPAGAHTYGSRR